MKYGYSLILGEYIEADFIEAEDCKLFEIVCPSCKAPVFKVLNTLSHSEDQALDTANCRLKVNSMKPKYIKKFNTASQKRKMKRFLSGFCDIVMKNEYKWVPRKLDEKISKLKKSNSLRHLRGIFREFVSFTKEVNNRPYIYNYFEYYMDNFAGILDEFPKTAFFIETHFRIAYDLWEQLQLPNNRKQFDFLFNNSFYMLSSRIKNDIGTGKWHEYGERLYLNMLGLMDTSKDEATRIIDSMIDYKIPTEHSSDLDLFAKMVIEIKCEILGCLLRVPYYTILKPDPSAELHFSG